MDLGNLIVIIFNIVFAAILILYKSMTFNRPVFLSDADRKLALNKLSSVKCEHGANEHEIEYIADYYKGRKVYIILFGIFNFFVEAIMLDDLKWMGIIFLLNIVYISIAFMQYNEAKNPDLYIRTKGYVLRRKEFEDLKSRADFLLRDGVWWHYNYYFVYIVYKLPTGKIKAKKIQIDGDKYVFYGTSNVCNVILRKGVFVGLIE